MMMKRALLSVVALTAMSVVAWAAADGFTLARKPKEGDNLKYKMAVDVDLGGLPIKASATLTEKVVKVEEDGSFKVSQAMTDGKLDVNGQEQEYSGPESTLVYAPTGEVKSMASETTSADVWRFANLNAVRLTTKTLNLNDTWTVVYPADPKTGAVAGKADYTLLGEEKIDDFDTFKVKTVVKETEGSEPASIEGTVWLDKNDGSLVKSDTKWMNVPFPGSPMPLNATVTLKRQKA